MPAIFPLSTHASGSRPWLGALLRVLLVLVWEELASHISFFHWNIGLGVMFLGFWWLSPRWWWLLAVGIILQFAITSPLEIGGMERHADYFLGYWRSWQQFMYANILPPFVAMGGPLLLRLSGDALEGPAGTTAILHLHIAALVSAILASLKDLAYVIDDGQVGDIRDNRIVDMVPLGGPHDIQLLGQFAIDHFIGAFIGIMLLAPLLLWWGTRKSDPHNREILSAGARYLLPLAVVYLAIASPVEGVQLNEILRLLLLVAVGVFALQHGWRGAALAMAVVSTAVAVRDHVGSTHVSPILLQTFIAIAGAMGLLLGAAMDENRAQEAALRETGAASEQLRLELAAAAAGNLRVEERERQRVAGDLHDEFGQTLTALQTHMSLMRDAFHAAGQIGELDQLMGMTQTMRLNISDVLERLRPPALDELGLYGAIDRGSVRRLAEVAGLNFDVQLQGDARLLSTLDDTRRIAAYRLVQEAITNTVRHAQATTVMVRLRINLRNKAIWLLTDVRDDGIGAAPALHTGNGLAAMRDRVTALEGRLHVNSTRYGTRVHALIRQDIVD